MERLLLPRFRALMEGASDGGTAGGVDEHVVALNYATLGVVDEILWLPSTAVAATAVELLYGSDTRLPEGVATRVGKGAPLSFASLLVAPLPLATLLPSRLGPPAAWRAADVREIRALARRRYRQLQAAFVAGAVRPVSESAPSLVHYTYGLRGRWLWSDAARRILDRVVIMNRAALSLGAAIATGASLVPGESFGMKPERHFAAPANVLDILAEALPPIAIPDFARLAARVIPSAPSLDGDESIERYQSLFAEMLSQSGSPEVHS